jgi:hypothetical protein
MAYINHERASELTRRIMEVPGTRSTEFRINKWVITLEFKDEAAIKKITAIANEYGAPIEMEFQDDHEEAW